MTKSCWTQRTKLEIALLCAVLITIGIISTLAILQIQSKECMEPTEIVADQSCQSQTCIKEALEIVKRIDTSTAPCDDFYAFSCNNLPTAVEVNTQYGPFSNLIKQSKLNLEEMYGEPIASSDLDLVKIQKKLYQTCMNETAIEMDALRTMQATLKAVGGWPVVEGSKWNESNFDWLNATYKLRQLGYIFSSYLDLDIATDPSNEEKYIFQISIPEVKDVYSNLFNSDERNGFMMDVAVIFGAETHHANRDMTETLDFLLDLQWKNSQKRSSLENDEQVYRATVDEIQRRHGTIDWLEFINRIVGRNARISKHDFILFPSERSVDEWFGTLLKASKRLQANYMMWKVVEENLPHLTQILMSGGMQLRLITDNQRETRSEYCIKEVRRRFSPSPIDIMYLRKYLPQDKKDEMEQLMTNFQTALLDIVQRIDWMDSRDKEIAEENIDDVSIILGAPGDYFDDSIFDNKNYNFNKTSSNNFIKLLSEANKNDRSRLYSLINKSVPDTRLVWWKMASPLPSYDREENEIVIPVNILQGEVFDEHRPRYLNYGIVGVTMKNVLYEILQSPRGWSNETNDAFIKKLACLVNEANLQRKVPDYLLYQPLSHMLGLKVSYSAYNNWLRENEQELSLFAIDYSPKQLFWISSGNIFCHYSNPSYNTHLLNETVRIAYSAVVSKFINSNYEMTRDFDCSIGHYYNNKCKIF